MSDYIKSLERRVEELTTNCAEMHRLKEIYKGNCAGKVLKTSFYGGIVNGKNDIIVTDMQLYVGRNTRVTYYDDTADDFVSLNHLVINNIINRLSIIPDTNHISIGLFKIKQFNHKAIWYLEFIKTLQNKWYLLNTLYFKRNTLLTKQEFDWKELL